MIPSETIIVTVERLGPCGTRLQSSIYIDATMLDASRMPPQDILWDHVRSARMELDAKEGALMKHL